MTMSLSEEIASLSHLLNFSFSSESEEIVSLTHNCVQALSSTSILLIGQISIDFKIVWVNPRPLESTRPSFLNFLVCSCLQNRVLISYSNQLTRTRIIFVQVDL